MQILVYRHFQGWTYDFVVWAEIFQTSQAPWNKWLYKTQWVHLRFPIKESRVCSIETYARLCNTLPYSGKVKGKKAAKPF